MIRAFLHALFLAAPLVGWAQRAPMFQIKHFGPEDGLSNRHVTALLQDHIGFIWVGSVSGLDRFDGHSFRNWSVSDGLRGGRVDALRRDGTGRVWVFSTLPNGDIATVDLLDPLVGTLRPMEQELSELPFRPSHLVRVGPQREDGTLLLGLAAPARCAIRQRDGRFTLLQLQGRRFEPLGDDRTGNIIGHLVDGSGDQRIVRVDLAGNTVPLQTLARGAKVELLITGRTTPGALYMVESPDGTTQYYDTYSELALTHVHRSILVADPVHKPLNITPLERHQLHMEDTRVLAKDDSVLMDLRASHPEVGRTVKDCMVDKSGDPWMATEFGLFHIEVTEDIFQRYLYTQDIPAGYGKLCRGMAWHNGALHVSTEWDGAFRLTPDSEGVRIEQHATPQYLFATHVDDHGTWWRGGPQVVISERADGVAKTYAVADRIWCILSDVEQGILLGGVQGLHWLDTTRGMEQRWGDPAHPELDRAHVLQLQRTPEGGIMATTSKGLYLFGAKGRVLKRWWAGGEGAMRLPYDDLHHCRVDTDGSLWLSTRGAGLIHFEPRTGGHQQYTMRNGFPNNMVYAAYPDAHGQLWLPTDGGIVRFDVRTRQSAVFTTADGLTHDEFNRLAHAQAPDGRLFFGGLNGITAFDPEVVDRLSGQVEHPLVFTGFMRYSAAQGGMVDRTVEIARGGSVELDEEDRSIQVSFSLLSYRGSERIVYAWRLAGVEDEWNYQHGASIRLDRLPYGEHTLEVKARDGMGQWSQHVLRLPFTVHMPWMASPWTWAGAGALGVLALLALGVGARRTMRRTRSARHVLA